MSRVVVFFICVWVSVFRLSAQHLDIVELGNIVGEMGKFESDLIWENTSEDTLTVKLWSDNEALTFTKEQLQVNPGVSTSINFTIDLAGLKGEQSYEVRLIGEEEIVLHGFLLKSRVFEAESDVFKAYRNEFFPFRATQQVFNLKSAFRGESLQQHFSLYNFGGKALEMGGAITSMPGLSAIFQSDAVPHHAFTRMALTLETSNANLGFTRERVQIMSPDSVVIATIPVQFTLEEMPSEDGTGPRLSVSRLSHDLRVVRQGDKRTVDVTLANNGRSALKLEKLESNCDCLTYDLAVSSLDPGQSTTLKVTYDATQRTGYERKTLALFTNDPRQPTRVLTFKAQVK